MYDVTKSRITRYLTERYKEAFLFDTLRATYWENEKRLSFMKNVPIPFKPEELKLFFEGGVSIAKMGENMLFVIGMDPAFPYAKEYSTYLTLCFAEQVAEAFLSDAKRAVENGDFLRACALFRGVYLLTKARHNDAEGESNAAYECDALFGLACASSEMSRKLEEPGIVDEAEEESRLREEKCGSFKAEAMELYETITFRNPSFALAWYHLGYCYLNMGLYAKTDICFKKYLALADETNQKEEIKEIRERCEQLIDPIAIEEGCNAILAGRVDEGISRLESYRTSKFRDWWPMHYYLAQAYIDVGKPEEAEASYKEVLRVSPSNVDALRGLSELYEALGKDALAEKYQKKYQLLHQ